MDPSSPPTGIQITIKPITSEADLPRCAHLADIGLKADGLHEFKARYGPKGVYEETLEKLTQELRDNQRTCRLFKAVISSPSPPGQSRAGDAEVTNESTTEFIVGFTHWHYGYVEFPKMDPFAAT